MDHYDDSNVFARILRGELPAKVVYEDDGTLAFLDIMPRCDGHTLVIPKSPVRNIFDISEQDLIGVILTVKKLAKALKLAFNAGGIAIQQFSEPASGQLVFHLHFHVIPRFAGIQLRPPASQTIDAVSLDKNGQKIIEAIESLGLNPA